MPGYMPRQRGMSRQEVCLAESYTSPGGTARSRYASPRRMPRSGVEGGGDDVGGNPESIAHPLCGTELCWGPSLGCSPHMWDRTLFVGRCPDSDIRPHRRDRKKFGPTFGPTCRSRHELESLHRASVCRPIGGTEKSSVPVRSRFGPKFGPTGEGWVHRDKLDVNERLAGRLT